MDYGESLVIGDRAFHRNAQAINELAFSLMQGLKKGGMPAVGKHFPGHGDTDVDSHIGLPIITHPRQRLSMVSRDPI